jgi:hypothetical protein
VIAALAGRRIDAVEASSPSFPLEHAMLVAERLRGAFIREKIDTLVCSAACGADLIALAVAGQISIRRRVILPFDREKFRATSVTDRPGSWVVEYDRILQEVEMARDLVILDGYDSSEEAYRQANRRIFADALSQSIGTPKDVLSFVVWDGQARSGSDATFEFLQSAAELELRIIEVSTL